MNGAAPTLRNPLLVALWAYGLFVLGNMVLYPHFFISSSYLDVPFREIASGSLKTPVTILVKGSAGLVVGLLILVGVGRITDGAARFTGTEVILLLVGHLSWVAYKTLLEEVVFRGMVTREFALRWGWPLATLLGGVFFAIGHMPGLIPVLDLRLVLTLLVGGVVANALFVSLFLRCGSLALPWGFHFAWNFVLTGLVGTVLSGEEGASFCLPPGRRLRRDEEDGAPEAGAGHNRFESRPGAAGAVLVWGVRKRSLDWTSARR